MYKSSAHIHLTLPCLAIIFLSLCKPLSAAVPADPLAIAPAAQILSWFESLPSRTDNRVVSGQLWGYASEYNTGYQKDIAALFDSTGKWPAMIGTDYAWSDATPYTAANGRLIGYWRSGGFIALGYHIPDPAVTSMADLINPSSAAYAAWISRLDWIALRLGQLSDSGVVVLWRPFHEMNGNWFWYGSKPAADFKAVWQHMFTYFTQTKGLHNLLWVYAPDDSRASVTAYYPGAAYVDIVGLDNYNNNQTTLNLDHYAEMVALNKPFGLTEFSPKSSADDTTRSDSRVLVEGGLKTQFPHISFFLFWNREWGMCWNRNESIVMNDPWVITRDEVDWKTANVHKNEFPSVPKVGSNKGNNRIIKTSKILLNGQMTPANSHKANQSKISTKPR